MNAIFAQAFTALESNREILSQHSKPDLTIWGAFKKLGEAFKVQKKTKKKHTHRFPTCACDPISNVRVEKKQKKLLPIPAFALFRNK